MTLQRTLCHVVLAVGTVSATFLAVAEAEILDRIVAVVNEGVITQSEIDTRYQNFMLQVESQGVTGLPPENIIREQILERLILESIQLQEAETRGVVIDDETLTHAIEAYAQEGGMDMDELRRKLSDDGISYVQFREEIRRQMLLNRIQRAMVDRRVYLSEQDVREFRESPFFDEVASDEFRIGHILLLINNGRDSQKIKAAEEQAEEIIRQLREGADFGTMAINYSKASTALEGGDLGWRSAGEIPSLFNEQILSLEIGATAGPIRSPAGIHIIQLLDKRGASLEKAEQTLVRHILLEVTAILSEKDAEETLANIRQRIVAGEEFGELAKEFSDDSGTALVGGDLGWSDPSSLDPKFAEVMEATDIGHISEPFRSAFGWHILEVMDRRVRDMSEEALDQLAFQMLYQRWYDEKLEEWQKEIRDEAFVKMLMAPESQSQR